MIFPLPTDAPPLREDPSGALRVGQSRVLLEIVIGEFEDGATPQAIVQRYPTTTLADVFSVIAYYLRHPDEVGAYLQSRDSKAAEVRQRVEAGLRDTSDLRRRLRTRGENAPPAQR